ncbi:hypothetical protein M422DRAFT_264268 [Sphaerobolus stellatus SS14]|uniref:Uncharacterized protein n=1 Tax=Sphaerobolus stellatus (strain SS14) TaxID=990650 RepID=A0A0C9TTJ7_SPHS4|nr:hypothetical protein M422DRAFT_264268 [Sphaerobolus stellatus SS14]
MNSSSINDELSSLLREARDDMIIAYRQAYIPPHMVSRFPRLYTISEARNWVDFDKFRRFINTQYQLSSPITAHPLRKRPRSDSIDNIESCGENRRSFDTTGSHTNRHSDPIEVSEYAPSSLIRVSKTFDTRRTRETRNFTPAPSPATPNHPDSPRKKPSKNKRSSVTKAKKLAAGLELPENWDIPRDRKVAYLVDLQDDTTSYLDETGNPLSMAAIIKNACTDSYGDGSCGSEKTSNLVPALGNIHCQNNTQVSKGLCHCSEVAPDLFQDYEHWEHDFEPFLKMWLQECDDNQAQSSSYSTQAAVFLNMMFTLAPLSEDGKRNYIGCSAKVPSNPFLSHTYLRIPACVNEDILQRLLDNIPADEGHTEAIVIPTQDRPHNHPSFSSMKLTYQGKAAYHQAIRRAGIIEATVHKVDNAVSTPAIFNNESPHVVFPALGDHHIKNDILMHEKKRHFPNGVRSLGVVAARMEDMKKNPEDHYIYYVQTEPSSDGNAQVLGLGDALLELIDPSDRPFAHTAKEIIQHIQCTCWKSSSSQGARVLDERKVEELELAKKLCLLPNCHNTDEHRYMNNGSRAVACLQKTVTHKAKEKTLSDIDAQLLTLWAKIKSLTQHKQGIKKGPISLPEPVERCITIPISNYLRLPHLPRW